jgi:tRNA1(Val) A37 N6-methylase TrmN6
MAIPADPDALAIGLPETAGDPGLTGNGETTEDAVFGGKLRLLQPARGHRAGTDAVLLAASTPSGVRLIADLGAASGIVGLRVAQIEPAARVTLIEREPALVALAVRNVALNRLAERVEARIADVRALARDPDLREAFDCVVTNPPFFAPGTGRRSTDPARARAHVLDLSLDDWLRTAATLLGRKGRLVMIHRADHLPSILEAARRRFGDLALRFVHPRADERAERVLLRGIKGSRAPVRIEPPLILHDASGAFTREARALHEGAARL